MRKLLVLADDFTGGLDTGAQFAAAGIPTVVTTNPAYCAADHEEDTVLVVDVETRHLLPEKARQIVEQTIRAPMALRIFIRKRTLRCAATSARSCRGCWMARGRRGCT